MASRRSLRNRPRWPLFLIIWAFASGAMLLPAVTALGQGDEDAARPFLYSGLLGAVAVVLCALAFSNRPIRQGAQGQLLSLLATFFFLPLFLALPVADVLRTTTYLNAYFDMVSALTTTGANMFTDPDRLPDALHIWRAGVGWLGGLLMWIAASAILAPMSLGGFEITARGRPVGVAETRQGLASKTDVDARLRSVAGVLIPVYAGLTGTVWILLMVLGDDWIVALCHAMSTMATSGLSPERAIGTTPSGVAGEVIIFLFMLFALSRLTFSRDTVTDGEGRLDKDPEFRIGILIVICLPLFLFLRHWISVYTLETEADIGTMVRALWGGMFTVLSFLTTTGFVSSEWSTVESWSGLATTELILMGLAVIGGGVATTAGGVKLLRVFALYLNGLREMERLVHPSSVRSAAASSSRIRRGGAFFAWVFFMMFALSIALITVLLAAFGITFQDALVLSVASLSTTGPLIHTAPDDPIRLLDLGAGPKLVLCVAMVLGRLEALAIIALLTPNFWRG